MVSKARARPPGPELGRQLGGPLRLEDPPEALSSGRRAGAGRGAGLRARARAWAGVRGAGRPLLAEGGSWSGARAGVGGKLRRPVTEPGEGSSCRWGVSAVWDL